MPNYNFQCSNKKCGVVYDRIVSYDESGKYLGVKCPKCGSSRKKKMVSAAAFRFAQPEGTDRWSSDSGGHDYRFKHNLPKVLNERESAERAAKEERGFTSKKPYKDIDDISGGKHFGPVK